MSDKQNSINEGHTKEWQDRARVMLDAKKAARSEASPNQSPVTDEENRKAEENDRTDRNNKDDERDDRFY
jgi:hypothetical protein